MSDYNRRGRDYYQRDNQRDNQRGGRPPREQAIQVTVPTPCTVTSNLYGYTGKKIALHLYTVTIEPEVHRNNRFKKFMQMVEQNGFKENFAYDGITYLVSDKKFSDIDLQIERREDDKQIARIEYKNTYDMNDANVDQTMMIQCLEIVSRYFQRISFYVDKKRMISPSTRSTPLGLGLDVMPGLVSTFKLTQSGYYLNLDMVYGVFIQAGSLINLLQDVASKSRGRYQNQMPEAGDRFYSDFERLIKNMRMATNHRERSATIKVAGILNEPATSVEFKTEEASWTVADYFAKTYKPLKYPNLPLLIVKGKTGSFYLPFEVCEVVPMQKYMRKLDEMSTSFMIKIAAQKPNSRFNSIKEKASELAALNNSVLSNFGMVFDNSMLNCRGTMLPAPKIAFSNKTSDVNNGSWNLMGVKAISGSTIQDWKIFSFQSRTVDESSLRRFVELAQNYGVNFTSKPEMVTISSVTDFYNAKKSHFNLVILPTKDSQRYEEIKRIGDTYAGVFTQCLVSSNLIKLTNPSFVSNLLLKINCKLGGKNWSLSNSVFGDKKTILIGIDVNHPGVGDLDSPSIVSVVGSLDYDFIQYKTVILQQERRQEIITDMKKAIKILLRSHYQATRCKPERIIVFRDGVGDSMFDAVFSSEVASIKEACSDIESSYSPELNFILAQKRHSIRFSYNEGNLIPGTIVDSLSAPRDNRDNSNIISIGKAIFDFFLVSHYALQGTARPVRYLVLLNESNFTAEALHSNVYSLCHLYERATKAVSVVPPIYYAHLGAARGKCYLERNQDGAIIMKDVKPVIDKTLYYL